MLIKFYEEVVGTMGSYGFGEMTVGSGWVNKYSNLEQFFRNDLFSDLFGAMHPLSRKALVQVDNILYYVEQKKKEEETLYYIHESWNLDLVKTVPLTIIKKPCSDQIPSASI